jgi:hypothetical protein
MMNDSNGQVSTGAMNNLTLELHSDADETFYLFSSQTLKLEGVGRDFRGGKSRQLPASIRPLPKSPVRYERVSLTPSPRKSSRFAEAELDRWTVRLCQRLTDRMAESDTSSATDDEEMDSTPKEETFRFAWYKIDVDAEKAQQLCREHRESSWSEIEHKIREAWDKGEVDILGRSNDQHDDGTYSGVQVTICSSSTFRRLYAELSLPFEAYLSDQVDLENT